MRVMNRDRRAMMLLLSIVLFLVLVPFLENNTIGGLFLLLSMYLTLVAATMQLAENRVLFRYAIVVAMVSMILGLATHLHPVRSLYIANSLVLTAFFSLVSVSLFAYLGKNGQIARGRLYTSVSLYLLLGLIGYALFSFLGAVQPGSFAESGVVLTGRPAPSKLLYFSLTSLTTLGYGDIVAVKPAARMLAPLEAAAGVLYIAITVARLVAAYETRFRDQSPQEAHDESRDEVISRRY